MPSVASYGYGAAWSAPRVIGSPYGSQDSTAGSDEITTIWVGDLPATSTDDDLLNGFINFGAVMSATVSSRPAPSGSRSGFVRFGSRAEGTTALAAAAAGQCTVLGDPVTCQWARKNSYGGASGSAAKPAIDNVSGAASVMKALSQYDQKFAEEVLLTAANVVAAGMTPNAAAAASAVPAVSRGPVQINWPAPAAPASNLWWDGYSQAPAGHGGAAAAQDWAGSWTSYQSAASQPAWSALAPVVNPVAVEDELATLWVGNLPEGTSDADLGAAFGVCGQVVASSVHRRPSPLGSYNGFVRFATRAEADSALKLCTSGHMTVQGAQCVAHWAKQNSKVDPGNASSFAAPAVAVEPPDWRRQPPPPEVPPPSALVNSWAASQSALTSRRSAGGSGGGGSLQTLFIGSLPATVTEDDVTNAFADVGFEGTVRLNKQPTLRGLSGFFKFADPAIAQEAFDYLTQSPFLFEGQQMAFDWAKADMFS